MKSCTLRSNTFSTCWTTLRHFCTVHDVRIKKLIKAVTGPLEDRRKAHIIDASSSLPNVNSFLIISLKRQEPRPQSLLHSQQTSKEMGSLQSSFYGYELTKESLWLQHPYTTSVLSHIAINIKISTIFQKYAILYLLLNRKSASPTTFLI